MEDIATVIAKKYRALSGVLNETTLRLWAAVEARSLGHGGVSPADPVSRGDPMSPLRWTRKSAPRLTEELKRKGHAVSQRNDKLPSPLFWPIVRRQGGRWGITS